MHPILRNILAVVAGLIVGGIVNMGIVTLGPSLVPLPDGADVSTAEGLREAMKLFQPMHFLPPFLAHALGTLAGAIVAAKLAASHPVGLALVVGTCFLAGGIAAVNMLGGPAWFIATDLILAYIPMGILGGFLARGRQGAKT